MDMSGSLMERDEILTGLSEGIKVEFINKREGSGERFGMGSGLFVEGLLCFFSTCC